MPKPINLVLLYGGKSGEHEVSLVSAASVLAHLDADKYRITPVAMDKQGQFHLHRYEDLKALKGKLPVKTDRSQPLESILRHGSLFMDADLVFPVVHGPLYEDGCLQGVLELAGVAYVGSHVLASAVGMDKDLQRRLACTDGLKSARYRSLSWYANSGERKQFCAEVAQEFGWPIFIKPCSLGSSVGIHKTKTMEELISAVDDALRYDEEILAESFVQGREIELGVLENTLPCAAPRVSVAGEIRVRHPDGFYSYAAKYLESEWTDILVPAPLSRSMEARLQQAAADVFTRLKCKGMARVDFFVHEEKDEFYFNEINTLPGFTPISMYPKVWEASGLPYSDLLDELVQLALIHHHCRQQLVTDYS